MPTIAKTVRAATFTRLVDAYCGIYNYPATVPDPNDQNVMIPNPMTRIEFADQMLVQRAFKDVINEWEFKVKRDTAVRAIVVDPVDPIT